LTPTKAEYICADQPSFSLFRLQPRRRTIHDELAVTRPEQNKHASIASVTRPGRALAESLVHLAFARHSEQDGTVCRAAI
jgi:hypothetical protein